MTRSDGGVAGDRLVAHRGGLGALELAAERGDEQVDLGREVAVERAEGDVGLLGDGAHLDGVEAALGGQRDGRVEDPLAAVPLRGGARDPRPPGSSVLLTRTSPGAVCARRALASGPSLGLVIGYQRVGHNRNTFQFHACSRRRPRRRPARRIASPRLGRSASMRIAMLSYRSKPHCGGQGIYLRHLSRELTALGHTVEVFSGQPYPELDRASTLTKVPSLDLYREPDPFRVPKLKEFRDRIDVEEFATMCAAGFPEPKTFSTRVARLLSGPRRRLRHRPRQPGARLRDARDREDGAAARSPRSTTRSPSTAASTSRDQEPVAQAHAEPLVRLPADAGPGRPQGPQDPHAVRDLQARHRQGLRRRPGADAGDPARRRRRLRAADRAAGARAGSWRWPAPTPR